MQARGLTGRRGDGQTEKRANRLTGKPANGPTGERNSENRCKKARGEFIRLRLCGPARGRGGCFMAGRVAL